MRAARVAAQAKVNLTLLVGPIDDAGFHSILTIFQRIDLADDVLVRVGGSTRSLDCQGPRLPRAGLGPADQNLAYRAALAYATRAGWPRGFSIELTKLVPVGGGLGGGSADAGAVLRALDALAEKPLGTDTLVDIGAGLGADVAFLASESATAIGTGRGERLTPVGPLPTRPVILAVPSFAIGTADAYRWLDEARGGSLASAGGDAAPIHVEAARGWDEVARYSRNDFEPVIERRFPPLAALRATLEAAGAVVARLAGSGSTVFGVFDDNAPPPPTHALDAQVIATTTASRVVQVEVLE